MGIYKIKIADCDLSAEYSIHEGMASRDGMTPEEALEYIEYNIEGAYVGEQTPCVMWSQFIDDLERDYDIYGTEKPKKDE